MLNHLSQATNDQIAKTAQNSLTTPTWPEIL
jgi:hypothetical protein